MFNAKLFFCQFSSFCLKNMSQVLGNKGFTLFNHPRLHSREQQIYFHCEVLAPCTTQTFNWKQDQVPVKTRLKNINFQLSSSSSHADKFLPTVNNNVWQVALRIPVVQDSFLMQNVSQIQKDSDMLQPTALVIWVGIFNGFNICIRFTQTINLP